MQRHPVLAPLSREHHGALKLARAIQLDGSTHLRATLPSGDRALAAHVVKVFAEELEPHFLAEDEVLLPAARGHSPTLDAVCDEVRDDHATLRAMIAALPTLAETEIERQLDRFGKLLEAHVRKEERALYEGVQTALDEIALVQLGERLASHSARKKASVSSSAGR